MMTLGFRAVMARISPRLNRRSPRRFSDSTPHPKKMDRSYPSTLDGSSWPGGFPPRP
jgi:hypothetical protein